ncbi:MAG: tetratricopeptide repeat protein, partial [Panacagrimonas sp.]
MTDSVRINPADFLPPNPTAEDGVALARRWHREGKMELAKGLYEQILQQLPDHIDALNFGGVLSFQLGDAKEGLYRVTRCVELAPNHHDAHANLGLMLYNVGDLGRAETHLNRAIELDPDPMPPRINLAMLRRKQGRIDEGITMLKGLLAEDPRHPLVQHALYTLLKSLGKIDEARDHLRLAHEHSDLGNLGARIAGLFALEGRMEEAQEQIRSLIELDPRTAELHHLLAAYGGAPVPERASDKVVSQIFDSFAPKFDEKLAILEYRAPELVAAVLRKRLGPSPALVDLLDAGCGTGLLAAHVRPLAHKLRGVDLSSGMLERAGKLGLYDELVHG